MNLDSLWSAGWADLFFRKLNGCDGAAGLYRYRTGHKPYIVIDESLDQARIFSVFIQLIGAHVAFITGQVPEPTDKFFLTLKGDKLFKTNR
jgi:hypothetical protein